MDLLYVPMTWYLLFFLLFTPTLYCTCLFVASLGVVWWTFLRNLVTDEERVLLDTDTDMYAYDE